VTKKQGRQFECPEVFFGIYQEPIENDRNQNFTLFSQSPRRFKKHFQ